MKLYEIATAYCQALETLTDPDMDFPLDAIKDTMESLDGYFDQKAISVAAYAKQLEAEAEAIKTAEDSMAKRRKALERSAKGLKEYLKNEMDAIGKKKITSSPWFVLSIQKNPAALDIYDEEVLPSEYISTKQIIEKVIDKAMIKTAFACGVGFALVLENSKIK